MRTTPPPVSKEPIAKATFHPRIPPWEVTSWAPLHATISWQAYEVGPPCCSVLLVLALAAPSDSYRHHYTALRRKPFYTLGMSHKKQSMAGAIIFKSRSLMPDESGVLRKDDNEALERL